MGYRIIKRVFDLLIAIIATIIFLIPWMIIAVIIKIKSPGPAIYKAKRVGKDGRIFTLYKFRSMRVDSGAVHSTTLRGDPRIFPFGNFLRKTKLDETLQLINILKGDMSVVGPRPEDENNAGSMYVGKYKEILKAMPGLSSPASLYDYTFGETYEDETLYQKEFLPKKLGIELYYVQHRSFWYDLKVAFKTIIIILQISFGKTSFEAPKELMFIEKFPGNTSNLKSDKK